MSTLQRKERRSVSRDPMLLSSLAQAAWWKLLLRGLVALAFGGLILFKPALGERLLMTWLGAFILVDGVFTVLAVLGQIAQHRRCNWLLFRGILSVVFGLFTVLRPEGTAAFILYVVGAWAVVSGICELNFGLWMREFGAFEFLLAGTVSILVGICLMLKPSIAALSLTVVLGAYAFLCGLLLLAVALRLRALT